MVEIVAGAELDRAVAEAIGWKFTQKEVVRNRFDEICGTNLKGWWDGDEYVVYETPKFSTNLNEAFAAAGKVGLFEECSHFLAKELASNGGRWFVNHTRDRDDEFSEYSEVGRGLTPALAICAAVLEIQKTKN